MTALERAVVVASEASGEALPYDTYRAIVRAVLMAVREPDDDVWEAGNEALSMNGLDSVEGDDSTVCFTAMIDAILNEKDATND